MCSQPRHILSWSRPQHSGWHSLAGNSSACLFPAFRGISPQLGAICSLPVTTSIQGLVLAAGVLQWQQFIYGPRWCSAQGAEVVGSCQAASCHGLARCRARSWAPSRHDAAKASHHQRSHQAAAEGTVGVCLTQWRATVMFCLTAWTCGMQSVPAASQFCLASHPQSLLRSSSVCMLQTGRLYTLTCIVRAVVEQDPDFGSEKLPEPMVLDLNGCSYSDPLCGVQTSVSHHH